MAIQAWKWKFLNFSKFSLNINLALFMFNINMKKWVMTPGGLIILYNPDLKKLTLESSQRLLQNWVFLRLILSLDFVESK